MSTVITDAGAQPRGEWHAMVRELLDARELLLSIVRRDLTVRYKHTALGIAWAVFVPLLHMLVFTAVFTRVVHMQLDVPYPVYAYVGLVPWTFFASSLTASTTALTGNLALVTKVAFPREVFPIASTAVAFVDFVAASSVVALLLTYYGLAVPATVLLLPVVLVVQLAFTLGLALLLALGNLYFRDVRYLTGIMLMVWMFATPVVYPVERIGGRLGMLFQFNPMTPIIDAYRALLLRGELPAPLPFGMAAVFALGTLLVGWWGFHRCESRFAELA